jgi:hypothetical protein
MRKFFLAAVLASLASGAQAATLNSIGGFLHGASGVNVGGALYDVEFTDGTCLDVYDGCANSDFTFRDSASALLASQALLDQVFIDGKGNFDSLPGLTKGCFDEFCSILTPYALPSLLSANSRGLLYKRVYNSSTEAFDAVGGNSASFFVHAGFPDLTASGELTWARWSPTAIPEPTTALLVGTGLAGIAARRRPAG